MSALPESRIWTCQEAACSYREHIVRSETEVAMRGYGQFCPVAKGAEVFAERWTPARVAGIVVRQYALQRPPSRRSTDVAQLAQPAIKAARTDRCRRAQTRPARTAVSPHPSGTRICADDPPVRGMGPALVPLQIWSRRARRHLAHVGHAALHQGRRIPARSDLCAIRLYRSARIKTHLVVGQRRRGDRSLTRRSGIRGRPLRYDRPADHDAVWMGDLAMKSAIASGRIELDGARELRQHLERWLGLSGFAGIADARRPTHASRNRDRSDRRHSMHLV